jgi:putative ABC transport system permease protein
MPPVPVKPASLWPKIKRTIRLGFKSLWLHRLRSLLTMLGIVFGVCSVIAMLAIGEGASKQAQEQIKSLGSQNIILQSVKPQEEQKVTSTSGNQSYVLSYGLTYTDVSRIQSSIPGVTVVVPARIVREYAWNVRYRVDCEVAGTVPWYPEMRNHQVKDGRFFTDLEMENKENVCVLAAEMVQNLFPLELAVGSAVRIGDSYFKVVGIMARRMRSAELGETTQKSDGANALPRVFIPLTTARTHYGEVIGKQRAGSSERERVELHEVTVKVDDPANVVAVSEAIKALLARTHKKNDYQVVVPLELLRRAEETKRIFSIVLGSIAAISLLVGGIGIMNIMLASVTERTREIGIRRAMGAKRRDIVFQFLVETVILSGAGGIVGVALGLGIPWIVTLFSGMAAVNTLWAPLLAFSISALVGVVFGIYPALRAARMDPVEALRHE